MKEHENKRLFTNNELLSLSKKINENIIDMNYLIATPSNEEYVEIIFKDLYRKKVCVTCDSLKAMTNDILKEIWKCTNIIYT